MTKDEIRIEVAKAMGWHIFKYPQGGYALRDAKGDDVRRTHAWDANELTWNEVLNDLPNFPEDLNACREMEKSLSVDKEHDYGEELRKLAGCVGPKGGHHPLNGWGIIAIAKLTALQRCEAFLRTLNLWKE